MVNMKRLKVVCREAGAKALPIMWSWLGSVAGAAVMGLKPMLAKVRERL